MAHRVGNYTVAFDDPPSIRASSAIGGKKEAEGPLRHIFDMVNEDSYFGQSTWEKAESRMQQHAVDKALEKASIAVSDIDCIFAGDLLNQCISSTYGMRDFGIPLIGLFGACSTMAESIVVASTFLDGGAINKAVACTSSHFCTAERQFRFPLEYGGQRTPTAQWTATAAGAAVIEKGDMAPYVRAATIGTIEDMGIKDANNMGAAMAPAAAKTILHYFEDTNTNADNFDMIVTGDLGKVGSKLLYELMEKEGYRLEDKHKDCGLMLFDSQTQDVHAGGSGCGCAASVLCGHLIPAIRNGELHNILFIATGALMSTTIIQQGESIPSIAHLVHLSGQKEGGRIS